MSFEEAAAQYYSNTGYCDMDMNFPLLHLDNNNKCIGSLQCQNFPRPNAAGPILEGTVMFGQTPFTQPKCMNSSCPGMNQRMRSVYTCPHKSNQGSCFTEKNRSLMRNQGNLDTNKSCCENPCDQCSCQCMKQCQAQQIVCCPNSSCNCQMMATQKSKPLWGVDDAWFILARDYLMSQLPKGPNQTPLCMLLPDNFIAPGICVELSSVSPHCNLNEVLPSYMNINPEGFMMVMDIREAGTDLVSIDSVDRIVLVRTKRIRDLCCDCKVSRSIERWIIVPQSLCRPAMFVSACRGFLYVSIPWAVNCKPKCGPLII